MSNVDREIENACRILGFDDDPRAQRAMRLFMNVVFDYARAEREAASAVLRQNVTLLDFGASKNVLGLGFVTASADADALKNYLLVQALLCENAISRGVLAGEADARLPARVLREVINDCLSIFGLRQVASSSPASDWVPDPNSSVS